MEQTVMDIRKEKVLLALLAEPTQRAAAKAAGVSESTVRAYLKDPDFLNRYQEEVRAMMEGSTRQAQRTVGPALSTVREIMEDKAELAQYRLQAARTILEYALKLSERLDVSQRIAELEAILNELESNRK